MPCSRWAMPHTRASARRIASPRCGGTISTAPSPPKRDGIGSGAHRFFAAPIAIAATKFTVLCAPAATCCVEPTTSVTASSQSSRAGRYRSTSKVAVASGSGGRPAKKPAPGGFAAGSLIAAGSRRRRRPASGREYRAAQAGSRPSSRDCAAAGAPASSRGPLGGGTSMDVVVWTSWLWVVFFGAAFVLVVRRAHWALILGLVGLGAVNLAYQSQNWDSDLADLF